MSLENDHNYMRAAMEEAKLAYQRDEVPIGAVLVDPENGKIITSNGNRTIEMSDPTAHAEVLVIREACKKQNSQRIPTYDLYVTLEPCTMCAATISFARIRRIIYGAPDVKGGGIDNGVKFFKQSTCHHKIEITSGIMADECVQILKKYFKSKR
jgi:tRNA(Arg) A34 adenosine deaminase TadA